MDEKSPVALTFRQKIWRSSILGLAAMIVIVELCFHRSALIEPIEPILRIIGIATGGALGFYFSRWLASQPSPAIRDWRFYLGIAAFPLFGLGVGSYSMRTFFEMRMFYAFDTQPAQMSMKVIDISSNNGFSATVRARDGARDVKVEIDGNLYANLEPYRFPGRDCLSLPVQIGRNGVRRLMLPATLFDEPLGIGHLSRCSNYRFLEEN